MNEFYLQFVLRFLSKNAKYFVQRLPHNVFKILYKLRYFENKLVGTLKFINQFRVYLNGH